MKKMFCILSVVLFFGVSNAAAATPGTKLKRGLINVVTSPVEIPKEIRSHWIAGSARTYHILAWIFCGAVKGLAMTVARAGSGVWDVVSFPVKTPANYDPLLKPDYVFESWPQREPGVVYKNLSAE